MGLLTGQAWAQATVPVLYEGPWQTGLPTGWSQSGLGTDYTSNLGASTTGNSAKFDNANDFLRVNYGSAAALLRFSLKGNPASGSATGGTFKVQSSPNGTAWTDMLTVVNKDNTDQQYELYPPATARWIRFIYTVKSSGNIQLDYVVVNNNPLLVLGATSGLPACVTAADDAAVQQEITVGGAGVDMTTAYALQLSDAAGVFGGSPQVIGTLTGVGSGTQLIDGVIPAGTPTSSTYRLRVVATGPSLTSTVSSDQTISLAPVTNPVGISPTGTQSISVGASGAMLTASAAASSTVEWYYGTSAAGPYTTAIPSATSEEYTPQSADFGNTLGSYYVVAVATSDCGSVVGTSAAVRINIVSLAADISLAQGATTIARNGGYFFAGTPLGASTDVVFTVSNPGTATLSIASMTITPTTGGSYAFVGAKPTSVAAGASANFTVRFLPAGNAPGVRTGTLTIVSNANPDYIVNFSGEALASYRSDVVAGTMPTGFPLATINYLNYQATGISSTATAGQLPIYAVRVRDGGAVVDQDNLPTILDAITFSAVQGVSSIRTAALFNGTNLVSNTPVIDEGAGTITFSNLFASLGGNSAWVTANDGSNFTLVLRVSFNTTATDNQVVRVTVTNANVLARASSSSQFSPTFTAISSSATSNKLIVTASALQFSPAPPASSVVNVGLIVGVEAVDVNGNRDLDATRAVTLVKASGTGAYSSVAGLTKSLVAGYYQWTDVKYNQAGTASLTTSNSGTPTWTNAAPAVTVFSAYNGVLWDGGAGTTSWDDAANWSSNAVPGSTDDVRLDNSVVVGSYIIDATGPGHHVHSLQIGYLGNANSITLNLKGGSNSADNLTVAGTGLGLHNDLLVSDGGVLNNEATVTGAGNRAIEFGANAGWQMIGTAIYQHNQPFGSFPAEAGGSLFTSFEQNTRFRVFKAATWAAPGQGLDLIRQYGNLTVALNDSTPVVLGQAIGVHDTILVLGNLVVRDTTSLRLSDGSHPMTLDVRGNVTLTAHGTLAVAENTGTWGGRLLIRGNLTADATSRVAAVLGTAAGTSGSAILSGDFTGLWAAAPGDSLVLANGVTASTFSPTASSRLRYLKVAQYVKLGVVLNGTTDKVIRVTQDGTLDFNGYYVEGTGDFILETDGTLRITDAAGLSGVVGSTSGNLRTTNGIRSLSQSATWWYAGTTVQVTGSGLTTGTAPRRLVIDNPTTVTLSQNCPISGGGYLEIRQGTFQESAIAAVSGSGVLKMSGGRYNIVKENINDLTPILLPQLDTQLSGVNQLAGGTIALVGPGLKQQVLRGGRSYAGLLFGNAGTKKLSANISGSATEQVTGTVTVEGNVIVDLENRSFNGPGGLTMTGGRLRSSATGVFPGLSGPYTLSAGVVEFANPSTLTAQTVRGDDTYTRTYHNVEVTGFGVSTSTGDFAIGAGGTMTVTGAGTFEIVGTRQITGPGNFVVEPGATFRYGSPDGISAAGASGNIQVTGTRSFPSQANYGLVGGFDQVTGSGLPVSVGLLYLLKTNATNQVTLSAPLTINTALILTRGQLALENHNLTIGSLGAISGGSDNSYIRTRNDPSQGGFLVLRVPTVNTDVQFPVGTTTYTPATVRLTGGSSPDNFMVRVFDGVFNGGTSGSMSTGQVVNRTWLVEEQNPGGSNATLKFQWNRDDELGEFNRNYCRIAHFTGGLYDRAPASGPGAYGAAATVATNTYERSRSGITSFSPFAIGDDDSVLPVELVRFDAKAATNGVQLTWATASERGSDYFEVQRSRTGADGYVALGRVKAAGTIMTPRDYAFLDQRPGAGRNYYRLRQVDTDGSEHFSDVRVVTWTATGQPSLLTALYPNPTTDHLTLELDAAAAGGTVQVLDAVGRVVRTHLVPTDGSRLDLDTRNLPAGAYRLLLNAPDGRRHSAAFLKAE